MGHAPAVLRPPLDDAGRALAAGCLPLARSLARACGRSWPRHRDEFESAACLALVRAAQAHDPARGAGFPTFAWAKIRWGLADERRRLAPRVGRRGRDPLPVPLDDVAPPAAPPPGPGFESAEAFEFLIRPLPGRQRDVLRLLYRDGLTAPEAARALGVSLPRVEGRRAAALARLRGGPP